MRKLSFLVAFRGEGRRAEIWRFVEGLLRRDFPEAEIVECSDGGVDPFHKTRALNEAARLATGDVFAICDADTWAPARYIRAAEAGIRADPGRWWRPWSRKFKLREAPTEQVLSTGVFADSYHHRDLEAPINGFWAAPPLLLSPELFEDVGGFDERFRGWGSEDAAFGTALHVLHGPAEVIPGVSYHLAHPRIGRSGADLWVGQDTTLDNRALAASYMHAKKPQAMRKLIADRDRALAPSA